MSYIFDSSVVIENMILKFIKQNNFSIPIKDNQLLIPSSDDRNNFIHRLTRYFRIGVRSQVIRAIEDVCAMC
jgi:hypothetical protein